jgi:hypothetical protein
MLKIQSTTANIFEAIANNREEYFQPAPASVATGDLPGSWGKIETLANRVAAGEELWHPHDIVNHIASIELCQEGRDKCQAETMRNYESQEYVSRREKLNASKLNLKSA